ncbi:hypothetical protein P7C73_g1416, partial [Tremellales sp. Uapishka_1]
MSSSSSASASRSSAASSSNSASGSRSASASSSSNSTSISIPATAAAGGITVTNPASTASASYYKIAQDSFITFGWNLTSLYVQPTSLTVVASCSLNGNTYKVGPTPSGASPGNVFPGNTTQVVWSPYEWEQVAGQVPFAAATYVLEIWDERGQSAAVKGGYLSPYAGTKFAMYRPDGYTSIAGGWTCTTCSAAYSTIAQPGFMVLLSLLITIMSAWGLLRR